MPLCLERFNDCLEFAVVDLMSSLYWYHLFRKEDHPIQSDQASQSQLGEDFINTIARYISLNGDMKFRIDIIKDWWFYKSMLQLGKGIFSFGSKKIWSKFLCQSFSRVFNFAFFLNFGLSRFSTNLCSINLVATNLFMKK